MKRRVPIHLGLILLATVIAMSTTPATGAVPGSSSGERVTVAHDKKEKENKKDKEKSNNGKAKGKVAPLEAYSVAVACQPLSDSTETTCTFIADGPKGKGKVKVLYVPQEIACLAGGTSDAEVVNLEPGASFASRKNQPQIDVTVEGNVTVGGTATYWVEADKSLLPAVGPGLVCSEGATDVPQKPATEGTEPTAEGSILVTVAACPDDASGDEFDWYGACAYDGQPLQFRLVSATGGDGVTAMTDDQGEIAFSGLAEGMYDLTLVDRNWCHAESDSVDEEGQLVVSQGEPASVWIFICTD